MEYTEVNFKGFLYDLQCDIFCNIIYNIAVCTDDVWIS